MAELPAGDLVERGACVRHTEVHGAWEVGVKDQEVRHRTRHDPPESFAVHVQGAGRFQQCRPLQHIECGPDAGFVRQQDKILHIEDARGLVGPLDQSTDASEAPGFAVRHRGIVDPDDLVAAAFDPLQERRWVLQHRSGVLGELPHTEIEVVDRLPQRDAQDLANRAGILSGFNQARQNRV